MDVNAASVITRVAEIAEQAVRRIDAAASPADLEQVRIEYLGRKAELTQALRSLKEVPAAEKPRVGAAVNEAKEKVQGRLESRRQELDGAGRTQRPSARDFDITMPGIRTWLGASHPIMQTMQLMKDILLGLGFRYDDYPEVETEYHNFDALNTPEWHPSRDLHDSFYTTGGSVMRTHTSAFQAHAMRAMQELPIRAMTSGRCYRRDTIDASHFPVFHQLDAIAIDRDISFADLKWTLFELARGLFGPDAELRFRPSYFPFTTPSAEVDVLTPTGWMEILGSGMMRPEVLREGGLDPEACQGFAFGIGVDRVAMRRFGIDDIRLLYENDEAFLRQF